MMEPLPFTSTDYSFLDSCFASNEEMRSSNSKSPHHHFLSSSTEEVCEPLSGPVNSTKSAGGNKEVDCHNNEGFWFHVLNKALQPTPILQNTIPYDESKEDAIRSFVGLLATQPQECKDSSAPLVSEDEEADTKVSLPHYKRRQSSEDESSSAVFQVPDAKRQRTQSEHDGVLPLIRDDQNKKWEQMFQQLVQFHQRHGHACVPRTTAGENSSLVRWVKRQRYQYKLKQEGKPSTMTASRMKSLESIGFVWDVHASQWEERFEELQKYWLSHGHTNVPSTYPSNPKLAIWVKRQRREFRLRFQGKVSGMTDNRIAALNSLGFQWNLRIKAKY